MRTRKLPGRPLSALLERAAAIGLRDFAYLSDRFGGAPVLLTDPEEVSRVELSGRDGDLDAVRDLLRALDGASTGLPVDDEGPLGLAVFLVGYEACSVLDPLAPRHPRDPALGPDALLRVYRAGVRLLASGPEAFFPDGGPPDGLARLLDDDPGSGAASLDERRAPRLALQPGERQRHEERVRCCLEHLSAGVLYQANLAHRLRVEERDLASAARFFGARLREREPPFAAFFDDARFQAAGGGSLISLSPECFLSWDLGARRAAAFPIKGTRPRGSTPEEDRALKRELLASEKDEAEHVMIVDLLRNDLGKVARPGGVTVEELMRVVSVPNVHHLESVIAAELDEGVRLSQLLEATVPGGSITGAPKSAALDVIHELEGGARGPYTGVLGAVDGRGRGASSILIRTWIRPDGAAGALHVGGGVVVGSEPEAELQETLDKARAFGRVTGPIETSTHAPRR